MKTRIMTVDLENDLRSDRCKSMITVVPRLLKFFDERGIKATFFVVASLLEKYGAEIKEISKKHEIASHSYSHGWLNSSNAEEEIKTSKEKFEEYGIECKGFRAPKFLTTENHFQLLEKYGYKYDSSFTTIFPNRFKQLKKGKIDYFRFPVWNSGLSYLKLLHPFSKLFPKPKIFYLHPWEFLEKEDLPTAKTVKERLLQRNCGQKAWKIFEEFIKKEECNWVSCGEGMGKNNLSNVAQKFKN